MIHTFFTTSRTQSTPDFSVAEHYGLQNTTCLYSKDVASGIPPLFVSQRAIFGGPFHGIEQKNIIK
jgi:hypothetical protein